MKLKALLIASILIITNVSLANETDNSQMCDHIKESFINANNINGMDLKRYYETCDIYSIQKIAEDSIRSMERNIEQARKNKLDNN